MGARLLLAGFVVLAAIAAALLQEYDEDRVQQHVLRIVDRIHADLQARVDVKVQLLRGVLGLFEASSEVTHEEFRTYVATLDVRRYQPSLLALGYLARVDPGEVAVVEAERHRLGDPTFSVWPPPTDTTGYVVAELEPRDQGNDAALGFNMASEPERARSMYAARDGARAIASRTVRFIVGGDEGFVLFMPRYAPGAPIDTVEERRAAIAGFVYASVRVHELLAARVDPGGALAVQVFAGTDPTQDRLLYEVPPEGGGVGTPIRRDLAIVDRTWTCLYQLRTPLGTSSPAVGVFAAGLGLGLALYQLQVVQIRARLRAERDASALRAAEGALQRQAEELERRVAERTAELERSNRELEDFASIASHDLQEPLRKIVAFGERLADELGPALTPAAADSLGRMRRSAGRLQQLITDLLAFARVSRAEVVPMSVDMDQLVGMVVGELVEGVEPVPRVDVEHLPAARGDPRLLRQLMENLLNNALKFRQPGERATVRVRAQEAGDDVPAERRGDWFRLVVEDEGIGFDPKYRDRIFQMFQRLHARDRYEGTGIGLAICQRVAELHGGTITAESGLDRGAAFIVTLPRAVPLEDAG